MLPETHIHVLLNVGGVCRDIRHHTLLDCPTEEIQLTHGRLLNGGMTADLETDALATTEGVEQTLAVGLELALIVKMDHELAGFVRVVDVEFLGIIRHEPVDQSKAHGRFTRQNRHNLLKTTRLVVEILEPPDNEILLALNARMFECLPLSLRRCVHLVVQCMAGLDRGLV